MVRYRIITEVWCDNRWCEAGYSFGYESLDAVRSGLVDILARTSSVDRDVQSFRIQKTVTTTSDVVDISGSEITSFLLNYG